MARESMRWMDDRIVMLYTHADCSTTGEPVLYSELPKALDIGWTQQGTLEYQLDLRERREQ